MHLEGATSLFCMCGAGGSARELDDHFLAMFTPADRVGRDGAGHQRLVPGARRSLVDGDGDDDGGFVEVVAAHGDT